MNADLSADFALNFDPQAQVTDQDLEEVAGGVPVVVSLLVTQSLATAARSSWTCAATAAWLASEIIEIVTD